MHKETRHTEIQSIEGNISVLLDALCRNEMKNYIGLQEHTSERHDMQHEIIPL